MQKEYFHVASILEIILKFHSTIVVKSMSAGLNAIIKDIPQNIVTVIVCSSQKNIEYFFAL